MKISLLLLLFLSFFLNTINNDFPLDYHADEHKKVKFIAEGDQDFKQPLLLLQLPRLAKALFSINDITWLARTLNAFYGVFLVFLTYLVANRFLKNLWPFVAAVLVAFSPIVAIHAHYIKEDVLFALLSLSLFWWALRYKESKSLVHLALMAFFLGLAASTKYIGWIFLPFLWGLTGRSLKRGLILSVVAIAFFALINYPLFFQFDRFIEGVNFEIHHALEGHKHLDIRVPVHIHEYWLGFHYLHSLIPGFTLLLTVAATLGWLMRLKSWRLLSSSEKLLLLSPFGFYLLTELSPLKAFPDFMRYTLPIIPFVAIFAASFWAKLSQKSLYFHPLFIGALAYMVWDSSHLLYYLNKDTRELAKEWMINHPGQYHGDQYASMVRGLTCISTVNREEMVQKGVGYLMASSFFYDRVAFAARLKNKPPIIEQSKEIYDQLFQLPCVEIKPAYKSFAYSNPTIRIIQIKEEPVMLAALP